MLYFIAKTYTSIYTFMSFLRLSTHLLSEEA